MHFCKGKTEGLISSGICVLSMSISIISIRLVLHRSSLPIGLVLHGNLQLLLYWCRSLLLALHLLLFSKSWLPADKTPIGGT